MGTHFSRKSMKKDIFDEKQAAENRFKMKQKKPANAGITDVCGLFYLVGVT